MVADKVAVTSRSFRPDDQAWTWTSDGSTTYSIDPGERAGRGTTVTIFLKEDAKEFLEDYELQQIVKKHSDFIAFPITIGDQVANQRTAIWRKPARDVSDEDYQGFYQQLTRDFEEPLLHLHIASDAPVQFYSVLFIPARADRGMFALRTEDGLKLYARKVLIQDYNKDFLPNYLRFVAGVVDSEDLPLNVARESIQTTRAIKRIGQSIKGKLLGELERIAKDDPEKYQKFWQEFGIFLKEGIATDGEEAGRLSKLLRFHSTVSDGQTPTVTLDEYVARMKPDQKAIYYLLADDLVSVAHSPHLDPFKARDLEVLYLTEPVDSFMLMNLHEYDGKPLQNVDDASLDLPEIETEPSEQAERLEDDPFGTVRQRFADVLGERVVEVRESKVLNDSPVRLAKPEGQLDRHVQRVYRMLEKDFEIPRRILELNRRHPLIHNLSAWITDDPERPVINQVIEQLFESALLMDGIHPNPADMVSRIEALMEEATRR
jgi:molecular chaperone HtpG